MPNVICWFRQDLRLNDNPAFLAACRAGTVLPVYILDDENAGDWSMGGASRWWLHHSLSALSQSLDNRLSIHRGDPATILPDLVRQHGVSSVFWNRCYEPWRIARDRKIKRILISAGLSVETSNGSLLWEPWETRKADGDPYRVFTPFFKRGCQNAHPPRQPLLPPERVRLLAQEEGTDIGTLGLLPAVRWDRKLEPFWQPGEQGAQNRLGDFLSSGISEYKLGRDFPARENVSRLSPHLHFGEISPNQVWWAGKARDSSDDVEHFFRELGWREFSHNLLFHFPHLPHKSLQARFENFPWRHDAGLLTRWQQGQTGYPIVDAGMRELWQTGYMHNRVRMISGSFLVKNLLIDWRQGERWFWDTLVDADLANNSAGWQWIAGCGADAAPYFRIFNPVAQGQRFDPRGEYTRRFVPELGSLPDRYLHRPWEAPPVVLESAGVIPGSTYPDPVVDLKASRQSALEAFASIRG